jgi:hypothetical protein
MIKDANQQPFVGALKELSLSEGEIAEWVQFGLDIEAADPNVFSLLPDSFADLTEAERQSFYRLVRAAMYRSPQTAAALYRALPHSFQPIPTTFRGLLFRCLQAAATFDPEPLPAVLPFLSPTLRALSAESGALLLERVVQLAQTFPAGVARLFRVLLRAYDEVGEEGVRTWIMAGEEIARKNAQAGEAFFALESRTSLLLLRGDSPIVSLSDIHGLLLKYIHMLCGSAVGIREADSLAFPPPLAEGAEDALPLPAWIEVFPTYEENFRLYRVLAAHQAGRVEFGTYDIPVSLLWPALPPFVHKLVEPGSEPPADLPSYFQLFPHPNEIEALFLFLEGRRIAAHLAAVYRGLREDLLWAESLTQLFPPALSMLMPRLPSSLWADRARFGKDATVADTLLLATELYALLMRPGAGSSPHARETAAQPRPVEQEEEASAFILLDDEEMKRESVRLSAEEQAMLQKVLAALRAHRGKKKLTRKKGATTFVEVPAGQAQSEEPEEEPKSEKKKVPERRVQTTVGLRYFYDEWDFLIDDYRTQWCQLRELPLAGDTGAFFSRTLAAYADLTPDIKREFQRLRPRMYRHVKGLEDGEDIDLNAAVVARVDRLSGIAPSTKLYAARQPMERDVAALLLLDLSASTDTRIAGREDMRVIDVMKEAVVLLSAALEDIGDVYAIYGFSSAGRRNVEVYPVKTFVETLSPEVKSRIGGLVPQRSTRMGAAVRHATRKLRDLSSRARLLVLLSDGYPEDADYGQDKHQPLYGVRDTMMALREAERSGILSFCLTVDKGGHDYLREMCAPSRYMVIEDVLALPLELPKIYQRHIRTQGV